VRMVICSIQGGAAYMHLSSIKLNINSERARRFALSGLKIGQRGVR
jgi:hypothetical protein